MSTRRAITMLLLAAASLTGCGSGGGAAPPQGTGSLLYYYGGEIHILDMASRTERTLGQSSPFADNGPAIADDGTLVELASFGNDSYRLYSRDVTTGAARGTYDFSVTNSVLPDDFGPAISPDGLKIAVCVNTVALGGATTPITSVIARDANGSRTLGTFSGLCDPAWTADNRLLLAGPEAIGITDATVTRLAQIGPSGLAQPRHPAMSLDGKLIAFSQWLNSEQQLFVFDTASGKTTQIVQGLTYADRPAWSPDSKSLVFLMTCCGGGAFGSISLPPINVVPYDGTFRQPAINQLIVRDAGGHPLSTSGRVTWR